MKKCPKCELNYIEVYENMCSVCKEQSETIHNERSCNNSRGEIVFNEVFTFVNEHAFIRGKYGFKAYNSNGEYIGIVYMTDDERSPSYGSAELCMLPEYYNQYGEWHRIKSRGGRVNWNVLCDRLSKNGMYEYLID